MQSLHTFRTQWKGGMCQPGCGGGGHPNTTNKKINIHRPKNKGEGQEPQCEFYPCTKYTYRRIPPQVSQISKWACTIYDPQGQTAHQPQNGDCQVFNNTYKFLISPNCVLWGIDPYANDSFTEGTCEHSVYSQTDGHCSSA